MKLPLTVFFGVMSHSLSDAAAQSLIEATSSTEVVAVIETSPNKTDLIRDAVGLGAADPVELAFALVSPVTPAIEDELIAKTLTLAAPRRADEIAASVVIAAAIADDQGRLVGLITALIGALAASSLTDAERREETLEVLAALLSVTDPELKVAIADAIAGGDGDGASLLAALGEGPETATIDDPPIL